MSEYLTDEEIHLRLDGADHAVEVAFWERAGEPDSIDPWDENDPCPYCMESSKHLVPTVRALIAEAWDEGHQIGQENIFDHSVGLPGFQNPYREDT